MFLLQKIMVKMQNITGWQGNFFFSGQQWAHKNKAGERKQLYCHCDYEKLFPSNLLYSETCSILYSPI